MRALLLWLGLILLGVWLLGGWLESVQVGLGETLGQSLKEVGL